MTRGMEPRPAASEDGWPYPDTGADWLADDDIDLDALELRADRHAYDALTKTEREILFSRFGLDGAPPASMKDMARRFELTHSEVRELLGCAIDKMRTRLGAGDTRLVTH
jgi:DNA-directed RNA polymerase sigma subunit (sigma70/sigma32)